MGTDTNVGVCRYSLNQQTLNMAFLSVFPLKTRILLPADYTFPFSEKAGLTKPGLLHIRMGHAAILNAPSLRSYRYT